MKKYYSHVWYVVAEVGRLSGTPFMEMDWIVLVVNVEIWRELLKGRDAHCPT